MERFSGESKAAAHPRRRKDLDCHELDGEAVLYDAAFHITYRLNDTGYLVWRLCNGGRDVEAIAGDVAERYQIPHVRALADVRSALDQMREMGLLAT